MIRNRGLLNSGKSAPPKISESRGVERANSWRSDASSSLATVSKDEMEYSSLCSGGKATDIASQQYSKSAVGAAAMAVEYGVGEDYFIGNLIDDSSPTGKGGKGDDVGENKNENELRSSIKSNASDRPTLRKLQSWGDDENYETVKSKKNVIGTC